MASAAAAAAAAADVKRKKTALDASSRKRLGQLAARGGAASKKVCSLVFHPSLHTYFLWSGILYLVGGTVVVILKSDAQEFLCAIPPQAELGGIGCDKTSSDLLLCSKPACWRAANKLTYKVDASLPTQPLYQAFQNTSTDTACSDVVKGSVSDPIQMVVDLYTASAVGDDCKQYHCGVLANALNSSDLNSPSGTCGTEACVCSGLLQHSGFTIGELFASSTDTSADMQAIESVCGTDVTEMMQDMCTWTGVFPRWCGTTTTTTTATTITATATTATTTTTDTTATETTTTTATKTGTDSGRRLDASGARSLLGNVTLQGRRRRQARDAQGGNHSSSGMPLYEARRLQTSTAGVSNDDLPDYEVGAWSQCTCYQQCTPGQQTRMVDCLATECKAPKPLDRMPCTCGNGAACDVDLQLLVLLSVYFVQAGLALIVFLCYLNALHQTEDDFIQLSLLQKLNGFFYKQLPPLIRFLVLVQLFQLVYLAIDVWVAYLVSKFVDETSTWQKDCFASNALQTMSQLTSFLWVFGVILGRCTKHSSRKPDWLFSPDRPARGFPLRQFRRCFRGLGP